MSLLHDRKTGRKKKHSLTGDSDGKRRNQKSGKNRPRKKV